MIKSTFELEKQLLSEGYDFIIGIDEAGRGPLAGPVVAAAALCRNFEFRISNFESSSNDQISNDKNWDLVRDSKTLSHKQRENLFDFIQENFYVGVGIIDHKTIDRVNILEASFLAMKAAISDLLRKSKSEIQNSKSETNPKFKIQNSKLIILLDGNKLIPNLSLEQKAIVSGDKAVKSISAASIIAKVTRDRIMMEMHEKYPEYDFAQHKGYGTKLHLEMLKKHGPCEIHRRSFKPVEKLVKAKN
jgi:ribonuclease HII